MIGRHGCPDAAGSLYGPTEKKSKKYRGTILRGQSTLQGTVRKNSQPNSFKIAIIEPKRHREAHGLTAISLTPIGRVSDPYYKLSRTVGWMDVSQLKNTNETIVINSADSKNDT